MFTTLTLVQIGLTLANLTLALNLGIRLRRIKALETMLAAFIPKPRDAPVPDLASPDCVKRGPRRADPTVGFRDPNR